MEVERAVTLAAGRGTRMKGLTEDRPKPMLEVGGRPMLAHQVERMEAAGVREVLIVVGYKRRLIEDYFEAHPPARARLEYVAQEKQDGTGSATLLAREFAGADPFLMTYGDILVEADIYRALFAAVEGAEMAMALKRVDDPCRGAAVYTDGDRVTKIIEKPPRGSSTTNWNNAGIYVFRASVFEELEKIELSPRGEYELTDAVARLVEGGGTVRWRPIEGFWRDIGRPEDLPAATDFVRGGED